MGCPIIVFESVTKVYRSRRSKHEAALVAVEHVSFQVARGELVVLVGPSACGKTTLLRLAAGLDFPTEGRVLSDGAPIQGPSRDRGMVFQQYSSFPWLTVLENVQFPLKYRREIDPTQSAEVAQHFLVLVGLEGFGERFISELSGGMQQRLAIARTLAADPGVLLMDEPFGALDAQNRELLQRLLLEVQGSSKKSILFVTHDVDEALYLGDRLLVLSSRPGTVLRELRNPLCDRRSLDVKLSKQFLDLKLDLLRELRDQVTRHDGGLENIPSKPTRLRNEHLFSARRH